MFGKSNGKVDDRGSISEVLAAASQAMQEEATGISQGPIAKINENIRALEDLRTELQNSDRVIQGVIERHRVRCANAVEACKLIATAAADMTRGFAVEAAKDAVALTAESTAPQE